MMKKLKARQEIYNKYKKQNTRKSKIYPIELLEEDEELPKRSTPS